MSYIPFGTIASQNANNVSITGGSITGITDLTITDGGTGASTAENARINLGSLGIMSTTTGIDGKSTIAPTNLYTVPAGKTLVVDKAIVRLTGISGIGAVATVKIKDVTDGADIIAATALTGLTTVSEGAFILLNTNSVQFISAAGQTIGIEVTVASTYTTYVLAVDLIGYLV